MRDVVLDKGIEIDVFSKVCQPCKHYSRESLDRNCKAFPDGIPMEIWTGKNDHKKPFKGDHGIQFTSRFTPIDIDDQEDVSE